MPAAGCRNRETVRVPRRIQVEVGVGSCRFREVERRELDRHSYEVQIKELTMRISDEGNFKAENLKLR